MLYNILLEACGKLFPNQLKISFLSTHLAALFMLNILKYETFPGFQCHGHMSCLYSEKVKEREGEREREKRR